TDAFRRAIEYTQAWMGQGTISNAWDVGVWWYLAKTEQIKYIQATQVQWRITNLSSESHNYQKGRRQLALQGLLQYYERVITEMHSLEGMAVKFVRAIALERVGGLLF